MNIKANERTVSRKIAIVGSGVTGLTAAHGLLQQGHKVSLYTDRTSSDWLNKYPPTGTAYRFASSLDLERELGLNYWEDENAQTWGVHLTFCLDPGVQLLDLQGRFNRYGTAIDVRAQSAKWTDLFEKRNGNLEIVQVDIPKLEEIAAAHDLTVVAAGKAEIGRLFKRDEKRSSHSSPPRFLSMLTLKNMSITREDEGIAQTRCIKFNFFAQWGESFSVPYWHKDGYPCWNVIWEAKEGSPLDKFRDCKSGEQTLQRAKEVVKESIPWDYKWFKDAELTDKNGWLVGEFTPQVKDVVGTLPSGNVVMALGDTAHSIDPIGGQGANNGYRQVMDLLERVAEHGDKKFDEDWMRVTFTKYWDRVGHNSNKFSDTLLNKITASGKKLLITQYGSTGEQYNNSLNQKVANMFCENFDNPNLMTDAFHDMNKAKKIIKNMGGGFWNSGKSQFMKIGMGQIRQKMGKPRNNHPLAILKPQV